MIDPQAKSISKIMLKKLVLIRKTPYLYRLNIFDPLKRIL